MLLSGWVIHDQQIKEVGKYGRVSEGREGLDDSAVGSGGLVILRQGNRTRRAFPYRSESVARSLRSPPCVT